MTDVQVVAGPDLGQAAPPKRREVLSAISGLIVGMFVALISSTVVSPSLPRIVTDLGGSQADFTWIVTASLLAMTVATPIWGKLADLLNRKLLVQISLAVFAVGSVLSGFAVSTVWLIVSRAVQGVGIGGLMALVQIVIADLISPRERGRYMGFVGAVMGVGQIAGPLIGGVLTDTIGWRWNFFIFVPFAIIGLVIIQRTLHLPPRPARPVKIDYLGAALIAGGVTALLLWVSLAGKSFAWWSVPTMWLVGGGLAVLALAVLVELRAEEPIIPLHLFTDRTFTLAVLGSIAVGVAMLGTGIFLSQYMQFARGATPTESGLMTLPMVAGQILSGIAGGALISRWGRWKPFVVGGGALTIAGLALMGTIRYDTNFVLVSVFMFLLGVGVGLVMQNLVLVVQNSVDPRHMGAASAGVTFFRTLGGTIGVSVMGAILAARVPELIQEGVAALPPAAMAGAGALQGGELPDLASLPEALRLVVENAYGTAIAESFLIAVPLAVLALLAICFLPNRPLSRRTGVQQLRHEAENAVFELADATLANDSAEATEAALRLTGPAHRGDAELTVYRPGPEGRDG